VQPAYHVASARNVIIPYSSISRSKRTRPLALYPRFIRRYARGPANPCAVECVDHAYMFKAECIRALAFKCAYDFGKRVLWWGGRGSKSVKNITIQNSTARMRHNRIFLALRSFLRFAFMSSIAFQSQENRLIVSQPACM
jgi:hypothetical protein